jgi:hypothetical protein
VAEVARMLHGVTVPPSFDETAAIKPTELTNRFQAAKKLTQAVSCEWVRRWDGARQEGDEAGAREAVGRQGLRQFRPRARFPPHN